MGVHVVVPEASLSTYVLTELERSNDCLFAVAYLSLEGVRSLAEVIGRRLDARRFSLRIVCCVSDFITDPAALEELQELGRRRNGTLKIRWHTQAGFHAKAYGFRKAGNTRIYIGSWNLTSKAIGADSGELGVHMTSSVAAEEAWDSIERFWDNGRDLTTAWLKKYKSAHSRYRKRVADADKTVSRWRSQFRAVDARLFLTA